MLRASKATLKGLVAGHNALREDIELFENGYGITVIVPLAHSMEHVFNNFGKGQVLALLTELCDGETYRNLAPLGSGELIVPFFRHMIGKHTYSDEEVYHRGDLERMFLASPELVAAYRERQTINAQNRVDDFTHDWSQSPIQ
ncbi:hypothetical protein COY95_04775 [Candidatus Woesearchaeota archaeon CG_4_10_14_0_8_um_filter_47_5]|nr:MAG: hypothetical protein COY95_04775 [Candidatus Woesearchaeota archaeon CG_4_10_14_0_8_um_filter_47_5]